jgi:CBS domain-containing protein
LRRQGIQYLLVLNKDLLVGIISDRDIERALERGRTQKKLLGIGGLFFLLEPILVSEIMTPDPVTVPSGAPVQEAVYIMVEWRFGALPVLRDGAVVEIITEMDLLGYLARSCGGQPSKGKKAARRQ